MERAAAEHAAYHGAHPHRTLNVVKLHNKSVSTDKVRPRRSARFVCAGQVRLYVARRPR